MKQKITGVLASATTSTVISTTEAGLLPGSQVIADLFAPTATPFVGSAIWQTSVDGTTWVTATGATAVTGAGYTPQTITLAQFLRLNVTAYTSGSIQGRILSDID